MAKAAAHIATRDGAWWCSTSSSPKLRQSLIECSTTALALHRVLDRSISVSIQFGFVGWEFFRLLAIGDLFE